MLRYGSKILRTASFLCALLSGAQIGTAHAQLLADLPPGRTVAQLDDLVWSQPLLDALVVVAHYKDPHIDRTKVLQHLILDHLLASYARTHFNPAELDPGLRVDFPHKIMVDNEVMSTLRVAYRQPLADAVKALPQHRIVSCVQKVYPLTSAQQAKIFVVPKHLILGYDLSTASAEQAKQIILMDYQFPRAAAQHISLFDVYERENVQGRMSLFHYDQPYLNHQMMELLSIRFVMDWTQRNSGLNAKDVHALRQALEDKTAADTLRGIMGMIPNLDEGSAYLAQLAQKIPDSAIHQYYEHHQDQFKRIDRIHAQHIAVTSEKLAQEISTKLNHHADFAPLAKKYSTAADAAQGGDLGWINHDESGHATWLAQVAMTQQPGDKVRPILAPGTPGHPLWELVQVTEVQKGFQREDGPSVHFEVAQILARKQAQLNFLQLQDSLIAHAHIHLSPEVRTLRLP